MKQLKFLSELFKSWVQARVPLHAAALSFFTIFAIAPLLLLTINILDFVAGDLEAQRYVISKVEEALDSPTAALVDQMLSDYFGNEPSPVSNVFTIIVFIFGNLFLFINLQQSIDAIWGVKARQEKKWLYRGRQALLSFLTATSISAFLLAHLIGVFLLQVFSEKISEVLFQMPVFLMQVLEVCLSIFLFWILFVLAYQGMSKVKLPWPYVLESAAIGSLLFIAGQYLMGIYLVQAAPAGVYGAASSFVALLLWVYFSAQIFLSGIVFLKVRLLLSGQNLKTTPSAQWVHPLS